MKHFTRVGDVEREYRFERRHGVLVVHTADGERQLDLSVVGDGTAFSLLVDGRSHDLILERVEGAIMVQIQGERIRVEVLDERERAARAVRTASPGGLQRHCAAMPGVVVEVAVSEGAEVEDGQTLVVLEAMKMQNPVQAEGPGVVKRVLVAVGQAVAGGAPLVEVEGT